MRSIGYVVLVALSCLVGVFASLLNCELVAH